MGLPLHEALRGSRRGSRSASAAPKEGMSHVTGSSSSMRVSTVPERALHGSSSSSSTRAEQQRVWYGSSTLPHGGGGLCDSSSTLQLCSLSGAPRCQSAPRHCSALQHSSSTLKGSGGHGDSSSTLQLCSLSDAHSSTPRHCSSVGALPCADVRQCSSGSSNTLALREMYDQQHSSGSNGACVTTEAWHSSNSVSERSRRGCGTTETRHLGRLGQLGELELESNRGRVCEANCHAPVASPAGPRGGGGTDAACHVLVCSSIAVATGAPALLVATAPPPSLKRRQNSGDLPAAPSTA